MATVIEKQNATLSALASIATGIQQILQNQENSGEAAVLAALQNLDGDTETIKAILGSEPAPEPAPAPAPAEA